MFMQEEMFYVKPIVGYKKEKNAPSFPSSQWIFIFHTLCGTKLSARGA